MLSGWVERGLGFRLHVCQYKVPTLKVAAERGRGATFGPNSVGGSQSMSGIEETKCEGGSGWASEGLDVLRWGIEVDTTGTRLWKGIRRVLSVPQAVEWKG